ncbi:MAG: CBS domain-containing protein [Acidobacteriota bacterium]|nr:CBS domain-containing protein [Acidobacteriota bacterium]
MPNRSVADIMTKKVVVLSPDTDIYAAVRTLLKKKVSGAPVVDKDQTLVGILSEKDCLKVISATAFDGTPTGTVADYMTQTVNSVGPSASIYDVVDRFLQNHFRRLPVVDSDGRLLGQVSRRDVLAVIESMRDNPYLYGTEDKRLHPGKDEVMGVDSAIRRAREG